MAISNISLTSGMRSNLLSLQQTSILQNQTQTRLSTGKKVNSSLDDPINYFKALANTNRASDLAARKDGMSEAIQTVTAATQGIDSITNLLNQAKSLVDSARTAANTASAGTLATQFNQILDQINNLAQDSNYGGKNLLGGANNDLKVVFNAAGNFSLTISANTITQGAAGGTLTIDSVALSAANSNWSSVTAATVSAALDAASDQIGSAINQLRTDSQSLSSSLSIVTARQSFTDNMVNTLQTGADNLVLADMNQEGANMLMLNTRQQLGTTALSLSSQAAQAVLRLF